MHEYDKSPSQQAFTRVMVIKFTAIIKADNFELNLYKF